MQSAATIKQSHDRLAIITKSTWIQILLIATWCVAHAQASTIYSYDAGVAGGGTNAQAPGQEVTTPSGGPWDDIVFNFYGGNGNPVALGTVFLLSQPYSGTASALSTSTLGFIADAVGGGLGGVYTFASSVTLQPNAAYYFYDSALPSSEWGNNADFSAIGAGYQGYGAANGGSSSGYTTRPFAQVLRPHRYAERTRAILGGPYVNSAAGIGIVGAKTPLRRSEHRVGYSDLPSTRTVGGAHTPRPRHSSGVGPRSLQFALPSQS
jgi:hypothetical protein